MSFQASKTFSVITKSDATKRARNDGDARSIHLFDRHRYTLADADAHGGERALAAALFQAVHRGHGKARAAHAQGMAERDGAAIRIDEVGIILDAQLPETGDTLAGKGLIEFDQIEIADFEAEPLHQLAR